MDKDEKKQKIILVYEDDPTFRSSYVSALETRGFNVHVANAPGDTTVDDIKAIAPNLISLDVLMPGKTGIEWAKELRQNEELKEIPLIFVSSVSDANSLQEIKELKALAHLKKFETPIIEIVSQIDNLLQTNN